MTSTATQPDAGAAKKASTSDESSSTDRPPKFALAALTGLYAAGVSIAAWYAKRRGLPPKIGAGDLVLIGVATHKLSRRITKDSVTSGFRAPFAEVEGSQGPGELAEEVKGSGFQRAIGELITCPFCTGQWVATGFAFGLVLAPRPTRLAASIFSAAAISDFLQFAYARAEQAVEN